MILRVPVTASNVPEWIRRAANAINQIIGEAGTLTSYTAATLPSADGPPKLIYVSDESGGAVPAFSDGTNWRRVTDRAIVS